MTSPDTPTPQPGVRFGATQRRQLGMLLTALAGVHLSPAERASLEWLAGWDTSTVRNIAAVIARARSARPASFDELPGAPLSAAYGGYGLEGTTRAAPQL